ncbi:Protein of unknown function [Andreprevotia lacus DSM 23236]|uniref:DUF1631 domain-containing protein n=1 Tax=Andreprevotia lacus DSM 23236 TaxID=1121001 RepID=A0A1W1XK27_9NEIS|nr:DUF1631 family protein [Andreprevotia lacus]SMC23858.1 Protein of unknown function [Andreprevotia lacus DSM 23236]
MQPVRHTVKAGPPSATLLACRDLALKLLTESLDGFFTQLEENYFKLAESALDRDLRDSYFQARVEAKSKKEEIIRAFREQFMDAFNQRMKSGVEGEAGRAYFKLELDADKMSLVANDDYEQNLTVTNVATAFKQKGGDTLSQLEQRLASLMPSSGGDDSEGNPLSPMAICEAFLGAFQQLESGVGARLVALRTLETELSEQVASVYKHINQYLIQQNIQPTMRRTPQRRAPSPAARPGEQAMPPQQTDGAAGSFGQGGYPQGAGAGYDPAYGVPGGGAQGGAGGRQLLSVDHSALAGFLDQLTHDFVEPQRLVRPVWFNVLDKLQQDPPTPKHSEGDIGTGGPENLLTLLRASRWAGDLNRVDTMTLELVAMLFDRLFEDPRLANAAKGLLARLQIPVLKAALLDGGFFGNKSHPARLLIDLLAEACLAWEAEPASDDPALVKYNDTVAWIATHYADDIGIFQTALEDLERFNASEGERAEEKITSEAQALLENEIKELASATASALIQARMAGQSLMSAFSSPLVNDFLLQTWHGALVAAYGPEGEAEALFATRVAAMDMLLWSIQPKRGAEERLRLVNELPAMLKTLEEGVQAAGANKEKAQAFFAELVQLHAGAIRSGMKVQPQDTAPVFQPVPATSVQPAPAIRDAIAAAEHSEDLSIPVVMEPAEPIIVPSDGLPTRGEWLEWREDNGEFRRYRLSWISPQKTRYLLTNRGGENGLGFTQIELIEHLNSGQLRRLSGTATLTEMALGQVRAQLNG